MEKQGFDLAMHYFRAFAIFSVISVHMWIVPPLEGHESMSRFLDMLRGVLFHSSTLYFVFISGYLFHFLAQRKFDLRTYYRKKLLNVIVPYVILSVFFTGYAFFWYSYTGEVPRFTKLATGCWEFFQALLYGDVVLTYWYIPFIATIFLVSPLLLRLSEERFALLMLFTVWIPLLIPRTELTSFFHNYAFFFPAYLLGMFYSMNRDQILASIAKHIKILVAFSLVFTVLLGINAYEEILPNIEAAYYMQKIAIGACVVHFLEKIKHIRITLLDLIATYSFALYFLHDFILFTFQNLLFTFFGILLPESLFFVSLFTFFCEVALCLLLIMGIKKLLGRRSRYVIGS